MSETHQDSGGNGDFDLTQFSNLQRSCGFQPDL